MKKKIIIPIIIVALLAVLVIPIPLATRDDGSREYAALTYKYIKYSSGEKEFLFFPNNFKSSETPPENKEEKPEESIQSFIGVIKEINGTSVVVEPLAEEEERRSSDRISFNISELEPLGVQINSCVEVTYTGGIMETYPAQVRAVKWLHVSFERNMNFEGEWIEKKTPIKDGEAPASSADLKITAIYADCFFAEYIYPMPYLFKINGKLDEKWCVGDNVKCEYKNVYEDKNLSRIEADLVQIEESDFELDPYVCYKPVIYLYPQKATDVSVKLDLEGKLTCTYPQYNGGWSVNAYPNGTLTDETGMTYNYLYWEGETNAEYDFSKGFCVKGEDTAQFLEKALSSLGLNRREANEFIVYWLPLMQQNPYNIISFQTEAYTNAAKLKINPNPDTLIRVFMAYKSADEYVKIEKQELTAPKRNGFTVVEWGGTQCFDNRK